MHDSQVTLWHTDDFSHAEYARAHHRSFAFAPHAHDTICLALILRGALCLTLGRDQTTVGKGAFVVINAGDVHAGHSTTAAGWAMRTIHVMPRDFAVRMAAAGLPRADDWLASGVHHAPALAELFFGIHACAQINDDPLKRDEHILRLLRRLARAMRQAPVVEETGRHGAKADRMRDVIEDNLCEPIRLDDLAESVALPPYTAVRAFSARFGLPPHRYQMQRRIDLARKLIRDRVPLAELSHSCGFADQAHFTRAFKRTLGYTPGAYARSLS